MTSRPTTDTTEISCQDSVQFVSLLRDGELSAADEGRLSLHLRACPRCQTARQQFETLHLGLDTLLARPTVQPAMPTRPAAAASPKPATWPQLSKTRRQWLGWFGGTGLGVGLGALSGASAGLWWGATALQTAQTSEEALVRRIAQYQALYVRETVADAAIQPEQAQAVLQQWLREAPRTLAIASAPRLSAQGLQLVRAQRLALQSRPVLQWVYLPQQGSPVALCGMVDDTATAPTQPKASHAPQGFTDAGMRGLHWRDNGVLWVLVAPHDHWSEAQLNALQQGIAQQLS